MQVWKVLCMKVIKNRCQKGIDMQMWRTCSFFGGAQEIPMLCHFSKTALLAWNKGNALEYGFIIRCYTIFLDFVAFCHFIKFSRQKGHPLEDVSGCLEGEPHPLCHKKWELNNSGTFWQVSLNGFCNFVIQSMLMVSSTVGSNAWRPKWQKSFCFSSLCSWSAGQ